MADLRVTVAGVSFQNPVIPASGAFGFGREYEKFYPLSRLGGISVKGMTLNPKDGNPPPRRVEKLGTPHKGRQPHTGAAAPFRRLAARNRPLGPEIPPATLFIRF